MIDIVPHIRATLIANAPFSTLKDSQDRYKISSHNESPTNETIFVTIEQVESSEDQNTAWANVDVILHFFGKDTDWATLFGYVRSARDIFRSAASFSPVGSNSAISFVLLGPSIVGRGQDPVTNNVTVSLKLTFGLQDL